MKPYFPVALDLVGAKAVVVGGSEEAVDKAAKLARAQARVVVVWPQVDPRLEAMARRGEVEWWAREVGPEDLRGARVVVVAEIDRELGARLREVARREGAWMCAIDQPELCDWVNMGQVEAGPVRLALASSGGAPGLLKRMRQDLQAALDERFVRFVERLVAYRARLAQASSADRARRLALALEGFRLDIEIRYPDWEASPEDEPPA